MQSMKDAAVAAVLLLVISSIRVDLAEGPGPAPVRRPEPAFIFPAAAPPTGHPATWHAGRAASIGAARPSFGESSERLLIRL